MESPLIAPSRICLCMENVTFGINERHRSRRGYFGKQNLHWQCTRFLLVRNAVRYESLMKQFFRDVWQLTRPYWRSPEKWAAVGLLTVIVSLNLGEVYISVRFNSWRNDFYNALQNLDKKAFFAALALFCWLALAAIVVGVYKVYLNQMLKIRWRRWMTANFVERWLDRQNHYRMQLSSTPSDNPDQRISEDIKQFIDLTLGLSLDLLSSVVTLFSFLTILWHLSGTIALPLGKFGSVNVHGYMVWVAMLYAIAGTWITSRIGRPLIRLNYDQQKFEADFRFALVRFRENSEKIALYKGEEREKENFITRFASVFDNYWAIMKRQKKLTWFTLGYFQIADVFPVLVAAPRFFAKQIKLGGLMQIASAFGQVQGSFSYIINAYMDIATWRAVVDRLNGFAARIEEAGAQKEDAAAFKPAPGNFSMFSAKNMTVQLPNGQPLLEDVNLAIEQGDTLLINGPSGSGKSTLLRLFAGIWPFAQGKLEIPQKATTLFLPQTPYLPLGTLRHALCYPFPVTESDDTLRDILTLCRLGHLTGRLDEVANWAQVLSPGEQQRIAFARAILIRPDFIFLDESTSALDEATEAYLYKTLRDRLPKATLVSIGHRATLKPWHARVFNVGISQ